MGRHLVNFSHKLSDVESIGQGIIHNQIHVHKHLCSRIVHLLAKKWLIYPILDSEICNAASIAPSWISIYHLPLLISSHETICRISCT